MDELVFIDTETTGPDFLIDRLFQVCYKSEGKIHSEYFKPPVPISIKAQSITHVTNKMVENREEFATSRMRSELGELLSNKILVAHNAMFDIDMLVKEGIAVPQYICTLKVARFIDEECEIPEYNLQYLRYFFGIELSVGSHEAEGDVLVLEAIFKILYDRMFEKLQDHDAVIAKMVEVSGKPTLFRQFNFGKHKGKKVEEVAVVDRAYMEWLLTKKLESDYMDEDWIFTLKYHLKID